MKTAIMMMAMYNAQAIIDSETVARDWFKLSVGKFHEKIRSGEIRLPQVLMEEESQKCAKGVHLMDLAEYVDTRRATAEKELKQMG
ncbi:Pyocin activator protein PrtN [Phaeobacter piscinae]|uniref:Pyocin activator protein PrtN n=1 Tax=Phaeobacter piscinae TaxID=1580596 RepID=A0AAN1GRL0_9RHOB|nr:pyocin activator PrtN family protein [Phaeobacter piscinae]ATG43763.1 Pyocin activator protein PrtN [Phaeobacter piscinae]AUR36073.1 Pyocin activator protein PrtN [Phaeobacter piscinae]